MKVKSSGLSQGQAERKSQKVENCEMDIREYPSGIENEIRHQNLECVIRKPGPGISILKTGVTLSFPKKILKKPNRFSYNGYQQVIIIYPKFPEESGNLWKNAEISGKIPQISGKMGKFQEQWKNFWKNTLDFGKNAEIWGKIP